MSRKAEQRPLPEDAPAPKKGRAPSPPGEPGPDMPFERALEELGSIVDELEGGTLTLEEAMQRFERGLALVKTCKAKLEQAELKVKVLLESGETVEMGK